MSKIFMSKGRYINIYNIINFIIKGIRNKNIDIYNFFKIIIDKLYLPIDIYKKKVAGRKLMVPNPNNANYVKKSKENSFKLLKDSVKKRKEKDFKYRLFNELLDLYYNHDFSISFKKKEEIIKNIVDIKLNVRYLRKKRKN